MWPVRRGFLQQSRSVSAGLRRDAHRACVPPFAGPLRRPHSLVQTLVSVGLFPCVLGIIHACFADERVRAAHVAEPSSRSMRRPNPGHSTPPALPPQLLKATSNRQYRWGLSHLPSLLPSFAFIPLLCMCRWRSVVVFRLPTTRHSVSHMWLAFYFPIHRLLVAG